MRGIEDDLLHAVRPQVEENYGVPDGHVHTRVRLIVNVGYKRRDDSNGALKVEKWVRDFAPLVTQDAEDEWENGEADNDPPGVLFDRINQRFVVVVHTGLQSVWFVVSTLLDLSEPWALLGQNLKQSDECKAGVGEAGTCLQPPLSLQVFTVCIAVALLR